MAERPRIFAKVSFDHSLPRRGSRKADEIYSAVGQALSWWESSEDRLLDLFGSFSRDKPDRIASYARASRAVRAQMLDKALRANAEFFREGELKKLSEALDGLKALVGRRNAISHGHCSHWTSTENGVLTVDGYFLVSAMGAKGPIERPTELQNAMTAFDIHAFIKELRLHRSVVLDAAGIIMMRTQDVHAKATGQAITYGSGVDPWQRTF